MNPLKTKVMVISVGPPVMAHITLNGTQLDQVNSFVYLGYLITSDGKCDKEIKKRIEIARGL